MPLWRIPLGMKDLPVSVPDRAWLGRPSTPLAWALACCDRVMSGSVQRGFVRNVLTLENTKTGDTDHGKVQ